MNKHLFNQGNGDSDPLPKEDEEADNDEEEDANDGGERQPGVLLLQEVVYDLWRPVQLQKSAHNVKQISLGGTWKMFLFVSGSSDGQMV